MSTSALVSSKLGVRAVAVAIAMVFACTGGPAALADSLPMDSPTPSPADATAQVEDDLDPELPPGDLGLSCTGVDGGIQASWTGAEGAVDYEVTLVDVTGATSVTTPGIAETSYTVVGLSLGHAYQLGVAARGDEGVGDSDWCDVTVDGVPRAPGGVTTAVAAGSATVSWSAPQSHGGSAVTGYEVELSEDGGLAWIADPGSLPPTSTAATVTGLAPGATYEFRVRAANAMGYGPWSQVSASIPFAVPGAPEITAAGVGAGSISVSWYAPESDGGSPVTSYLVRYSTNGLTWSTISVPVPTTNRVLTGLANGTTYEVQVIAVNAAGGSSPSATVSATPRTVSSAPRSVRLTPGNASITLGWVAPSSTGGAARSAYTAQVSTDGVTWRTVSTSISPSATSYRITGLTNGTSYRVRVLAKNVAGNGAWSAVVSATPRTVPSAPRSVTATPGSRSITVRWVAPSSSGGASRTVYAVQVSTNGLTWRTVSNTISASATSYRITGLTNGTSYRVRVLAKNVAGNGAWSSVVSAKPRTVPSAPRATGSTPRSGQVKISWSAPSSGGSAISSYVIQRYSGGTWRTVATVGASSRSKTFSGLTNGVAYKFRVVAKNAAGTGKWSSTVTVTPKKPASSGSCHPAYTGACVPIASDVDCAGGSGNGPAYVRGPVYVKGDDPYDLDRDGDGVACER